MRTRARLEARRRRAVRQAELRKLSGLRAHAGSNGTAAQASAVALSAREHLRAGGTLPRPVRESLERVERQARAASDAAQAEAAEARLVEAVIAAETATATTHVLRAAFGGGRFGNGVAEEQTPDGAVVLRFSADDGAEVRAVISDGEDVAIEVYDARIEAVALPDGRVLESCSAEEAFITAGIERTRGSGIVFEPPVYDDRPPQGFGPRREAERAAEREACS